MNWFLYAVIGIVLITIYSIGTKILVADRVADPISLVVVYKFICSLCVALLILVTGQSILIRVGWFEGAMLIIGSIVFGIANIAVFKAYPITEVSDISLIGATQPVITMLLGAALFREGLTVPKVLAATLCLVGVWLIFPRKAGVSMTRGHLYALISTCAFALGSYIDKTMVMRIPVVQYAAIGYLVNAVTMMIGTRRSFPDLRRVLVRRSTTLWIILLASISGFGSLFYIQAYAAGGQASEVSLVLYLNVVLTVMFGALFLRERDRLPQKISAFVLTLAALMLIR